MIKVSNELDFKNWFIKNYRKLGFSEIIRKDIDINRNTAESGLMNLAIEGRIERFKKKGVNIWIPKRK